MVERVCVDDVDRSGRELEIVEIAVNDVAIVIAGVEIDPDRDRPEVEKRLHFGADAGAETKNAAAGPIDIERGQSFAQDVPELRVVGAEIVRLKLRFLVFQISFVGSVAAFLKTAVLPVPALAELPKQGSLSQRTIQPIKGTHYFVSKVSTP